MTKNLTDRKQNEATAIAFLRKNPDILMAYPDLLGLMHIPHQTTGATSLIERQIRLLRAENQTLKTSITELKSIAKENEALNRRFHRLALELMCAEELDDVLTLVQYQAQTFFYTDYVRFHFLPTVTDHRNRLDQYYFNCNQKILQTIQLWLQNRHAVCGQLDEDMNRALFGETTSIGSSAIIPLFQAEDIGLLCLGSISENRFKQSMGSIFLEQLGELVSVRIRGLCDTE